MWLHCPREVAQDHPLGCSPMDAALLPYCPPGSWALTAGTELVPGRPLGCISGAPRPASDLLPTCGFSGFGGWYPWNQEQGHSVRGQDRDQEGHGEARNAHLDRAGPPCSASPHTAGLWRGSGAPSLPQLSDSPTPAQYQRWGWKLWGAGALSPRGGQSRRGAVGTSRAAAGLGPTDQHLHSATTQLGPAPPLPPRSRGCTWAPRGL